MLIIDQLKLSIGSRVLAENICASWPRGSLVSILGPNGCGKTTLLNKISGIGPLAPGNIFIDETDLRSLTPLERAQRIASVAQYDEADLEIIARDRIAHGLYPRKRSKGLSAPQETALIKRAAQLLHIEDLLLRPLASLSGGQRKKVHLARALVDDLARVYVIDEPDANLDADSKDNLMQVLKQLSNNEKVLIVSLHNRDLADKYCDYRLELGPTLAQEE